MNRAIQISLLLLFIGFLIVHYFIMTIEQEYFPVFAHFYPFVAKVWFEIGRFILFMNLPFRLEELFFGLRNLLLLEVAIALFAFKYHSFYKATLWLASIFFGLYLMLIFYLGLATLYPIFTVVIAVILATYLAVLKNNSSPKIQTAEKPI